MAQLVPVSKPEAAVKAFAAASGSVFFCVTPGELATAQSRCRLGLIGVKKPGSSERLSTARFGLVFIAFSHRQRRLECLSFVEDWRCDTNVLSWLR
jgi:hypothetical protein